MGFIGVFLLSILFLVFIVGSILAVIGLIVGIILNIIFTKKKNEGKRIKRCLYQTKNGSIINADINGALNMIRKCNSNELNIQMSRGLTSPCRIHVRL